MQLHRIALAVAAAFPLVVLAQGIATEAQLKTVLVASARAPLDPNLPSSTASKTAEQLREQTIYNPEDIAVNLLIFILASFLGLGLIHGVAKLLHTPLMSLTNAISAIAVSQSISSNVPSSRRRNGEVSRGWCW